MYHEIDQWRQRHHELLREADERRLARQLRAERPKLAAPAIKSALLALIPRRLPRRKEMAGC